MSVFGLMVQSVLQLLARKALSVVSSLSRTSTSELSGDQASGAEAWRKATCFPVCVSSAPTPLVPSSRCQGAASSQEPSGDQESARVQGVVAQRLSGM